MLSRRDQASGLCLYSAYKYEAASAPGAESMLASLGDDQTILLQGWAWGGRTSDSGSEIANIGLLGTLKLSQLGRAASREA